MSPINPNKVPMLHVLVTIIIFSSWACSSQPSKSFHNSMGMQFTQVEKERVLRGKTLYASIYETDIKTYNEFARATNRQIKTCIVREPSGAIFIPSDNNPVENVSWDEAVEFCEWLTKVERTKGMIGPKEQYRLPSDREWSRMAGIEKIERHYRTPLEASGKSEGFYPWGEKAHSGIKPGNYAGKERSAYTEAYDPSHEDKYPWTAPGGKFPPMPNGLFDLGGNVWEWCGDEFDYEKSKRKVLRGNSYLGVIDAGSNEYLSSFRLISDGRESQGVGFRVVITR